ncbi:CcdB family protein [Sphingomonas donggukensis]|uniref:Toxin CcdB n=1 Tax=Sphingomonas donggukensis TaxID=2949093 RepID=A0ABY4TX55_9SPHN|nr:CcdB family protein [Sphingomonas donggukensis]URW75739.1 CcdB family protein [Sphingomonas donggukensis]
MAQFDVHRLRDGAMVVDVQSDLLSTLTSRLVIPLVPPGEDAQAMDRLHPVVEVLGKPYLVATHLAGAVARRDLGPLQASLSDEDFAIKSALDFLISGF